MPSRVPSRPTSAFLSRPKESFSSIIQCNTPGRSFRNRGKIGSGNVRPSRKEIKKESTMKQLLLSMALAVAAPFAWAQVSETTTTTTTTEGNGTITEYTPGSTIVLRETSGPRTYHFGKTVTYVTRSGRTLGENTPRKRVKVGIPVRVHYVGTGDNMKVDCVIIDED